MIVKNEAASIVDTVDSVRPYVDMYTILDTGSTDGTQKLIREAFKDTPGRVYEEPFIDFASSRNRAIELNGNRSVWVLMLSGDETLQNGQALREYCERGDEDAWNVVVDYGSVSRFDSTRIHRSRSTWRYKGVTHEYMTNDQGHVATQRIPGVFIYHNISSKTLQSQEKRWRRDVELLLHAWSFTEASPRVAFFIAQSYECLHDYEKALRWYKTRLRMGGWREEVYETWYRIGIVRQTLGHAWEEVMPAYLKAYEIAPHRAEPLYSIASYYRVRKHWSLAFLFLHQALRLPFPENDRLSKNVAVYEYHRLEAFADVAHRVNEKEFGKRVLLNALDTHENDIKLLKLLRYYV